MKFLKIFISFVLLTLIFVSCKDDMDRSIESIVIDPSFDYDELGKEHNRGLDYVYESIKERKNVDSLISRDEIINLTLSATGNFMNKESVFRNDKFLFESRYDESAIKRAIISQDDIPLKNIEMDDIVIENLETDDAILIYKTIKLILTDDESDIKNILDQLSGIEKMIHLKNLSSNDELILKSMCSVARYSSEYWSQNALKWVELLEYSNETIDYINNLKDICTDTTVLYPLHLNWEAIAASDALAAATGATHLVISGAAQIIAAAGPEGWLGLGIVIAGYAIEGSASALLIDLWL